MGNSDSVPLDTLLAHRHFVVGLARALARDASAADDLEQATWLAALRRPPREGGSVPSWLALVLRRARKDQRRATLRRERRERADAPRELARTETPAAEVAERAEIHRLVVLAAFALDEPYRTTVYLRFFEGLDCAEIARREGIAAATVRKRLERAIGTLRERLKAACGDDERQLRAALLPLLSGIGAGELGLGGLAGSAVATTGNGGLAMTMTMKVGAAVLSAAGLGTAVLTWQKAQASDVPTAQLAPANPASTAYYGFSVALDGDVAVVGAPIESGANGAAYIFERSGGAWGSPFRFGRPSGASSQFGQAVAVHGGTVMLSAFNGGPGSVYVYERDTTTWNQVQNLAPTGGASGDEFGVSISLADGVLLVGAHHADFAGLSDSGTAYVFRRGSDGVWTEEAELTRDTPAAGDTFGECVALSSDGLTAVVGAPGAATAYVYEWTSSGWSAPTELTVSGVGAGDRFGDAVVTDGQTIAVSARFQSVGGVSGAGAVYVFERTASGFGLDTTLSAADASTGAGLGRSMALDADRLLVGAYNDSEGGSLAGAAYVFTRAGGTWSETQKFRGAAAVDLFGVSAALQGTTGIVGAHGHDVSGSSDNGAAYLIDVATADDTAPSLTLPADITVEATGASGSVVTFAPTATDDVDGSVTVTCSPASGSTFAIGATTVTCSASDAAGNTASGSFTVTVQDTTAPTISVSGLPSNMWPPNHSLVSFVPTLSVQDACDASPSVTLTVSANETLAVGDVVIRSPGDFDLRAEKDRVYTLVWTATDASGNAGTITTTVTVAKPDKDK